MNYCRDYYNANEVAQESYDELHAWEEQPTLCDCGRGAEHGDVYCKSRKETIAAAMREARRKIMQLNDFDQNSAEDAMVDWWESPEKYGEE